MTNPTYVLILTTLLAACDTSIEGDPGDELDTSEAGSGSYVWTSYSVLPIFFVPRDWDVSSAEVQAEAASIRSALGEIQSYYGNRLGHGFDLHGLQVVQGEGSKEAYGIQWNGRDIYVDGVDIVGNVEATVVDELYRRGYPVPPGQNESGYVTVMLVKGAGGWAGSRELSNGNGGWSIVGDWCIDSLNNDLVEGQYGWQSGRRPQLGALAHEIGHAFGFDHPDAYGQPFNVSVMGNWWDYPTIGFSDEDRRRAMDEKVPFFCRRVGLVADSGQYVVAEGGGGREVRADRWAQGAWETFDLVPMGGDRHALRAASGQYVVAEGGGGGVVNANRWSPAAWETFHMVCAD